MKVTGPCPGEKLYEELFWDFECAYPIEQGAIFALLPSPELKAEVAATPRFLESLIKAAQVGDEKEARILLKKTAVAISGAIRKAFDPNSDIVLSVPSRTLAPNGNGHGGPSHLEESSI